MDASQYKDYVLVLLFVKYVSDKYAGVPYAPITIPKGSSFKDILTVRPGTSEGARQAILDEWYRNLLKETAAPIIARWEPRLSVQVKRVFIQQMKTKWGSCNHRAGTIRLNTELAKKPRECVEYLIVHELVHLLEPTHNARFIALMDRHMPRWHFYREVLNRLPLRHEHWEY
jgi:predicted metal-dependent hydrolase